MAAAGKFPPGISGHAIHNVPTIETTPASPSPLPIPYPNTAHFAAVPSQPIIDALFGHVDDVPGTPPPTDFFIV
jgi:hypothetical protein